MPQQTSQSSSGSGSSRRAGGQKKNNSSSSSSSKDNSNRGRSNNSSSKFDENNREAYAYGQTQHQHQHQRKKKKNGSETDAAAAEDNNMNMRGSRVQTKKNASMAKGPSRHNNAKGNEATQVGNIDGSRSLSASMVVTPATSTYSAQVSNTCQIGSSFPCHSCHLSSFGENLERASQVLSIRRSRMEPELASRIMYTRENNCLLHMYYEELTEKPLADAYLPPLRDTETDIGQHDHLLLF